MQSQRNRDREKCGDPSVRGSPAGLGRLGRHWCIILLHLGAFLSTYYLSYWLRFDGQFGAEEVQTLQSTLPLVLILKLLVFGGLNVYQGWGRFITFDDLVALIKGATLSLLALVLLDRLLLPECLIPRSILLLDWGATILVVGGIQAVRRLVREREWGIFLPEGKIAALIVGADDTGEALLHTIIRHGDLTYHVVGFIDRDRRRIGTLIGRVPILGTPDEVCLLAQRHRVEEVLLTSGQLTGVEVRELIAQAEPLGIHVRVLPSFGQLFRGGVSISPRPVRIEDLLHREPVRLDAESVRNWIDGRTIMVTGSAGSIGSEICRQLVQFSPRRITMVDRSESGQFFLERELSGQSGEIQLDVCTADVLDRPRIGQILQQCRPDIIFHAAAYKHVSLMERFPGEAVKNTLMATCRIADLAVAYHVPSFVLVSSDKAIRPSCVMGACKRAAELYLQSLSGQSECRFVTVRFGNVLDSSGSVVQIFRQQIERGGPVTVTDPRVERYFMTIPEAARLVVEAGAIGENGSTLMLDMGSPVRILDLAEDMIRLSGLEVGKDIPIEFTRLQPGEKLKEDLSGDGEQYLPTQHPKISVVASPPCNAEEVSRKIAQLLLVRDAEREVIIQHLRQVVPEFRPSCQYGQSEQRRAA